MAGLGKKILSAFLEVIPTPPKAAGNPENDSGAGQNSRTEYPGQDSQAVRPVSGQASDPETGQAESRSGSAGQATEIHSRGNSRFSEYFDKLFSEANIPGPDYYEFSKMTEAMQSIPHEQSRFHAAYAGLSAQGVDKAKLLSTAEEYLRILETDAQNFHRTVDTAMQEKVQRKKAEVDEKTTHIQALSQEIAALQNQIAALHSEIKENEEKIEVSTGGYVAENTRRKARIQADIEKMKNYLH